MRHAFKLVLLAAAAAIMTALALPAFADDAPRLALIINQVDYTTLTALNDTDTEAGSMKTALVKLGFDVTSARDLTVEGHGGHQSFDQVLTDFRRKVSASPGAIVFVYYTGHGMADPTDQGGGENYLLGVDADIRVAADLPPSGIKLSQVTTQFSRAGAQAVIIVLDACRDTPTIGKGVSKGLVSIQPEDNTLIAYSTDLGHVAETNAYAPVLATELLKPGEKISDVFTNVQIAVSEQTEEKQQPWMNNRIYKVICLAGCEVNVSVPAATPTGLSASAQMEQTFWQSIQGCDDYTAYLDKYPDGTFTALARTRLAAPACQTAPQQAEVTPPPPPPGQQRPVVDAAYSCDIEAGGEFDSDRPPGDPFVAAGKIVPDRAIAACQTALQADSGNRHLMYNLAEAHRWAATVADAAAAVGLLNTAADKGSAAAMYALGVMYSRGEGLAQNDNTALQWFQKASQAGNAEAMAWIGMFASAGRAGPVNTTAALFWNRKAADMGVNYAMANLGAIYYYGTGVTQDYAASELWYEKAAGKGFVGAMTAVAHLYEQGLGVAQNYPAAMQWYQTAAANGDSDSMAMLGNMYYNGEGITADPVTARQWYEKAAALGNVASMTFAGAMYQNGLGGVQDNAMARHWYEQAAAKGDSWASNALLTLPN